MSWAPWSKADEASLAGYVQPDVVRRLGVIKLSRNRERLVAAIYDALLTVGVRYAPEKYAPERELQEIRTPDEILVAPREGTCLDLAVLFCGACLGYDLLPVLVVLDDHALAAVSLRFGRRDQRDAGRGAELDWSDLGRGRVTSREQLAELVDDGDWLAVECTGFARADGFSTGVPEGRGRVDGVLPFTRATTAGREQLDARKLRFGLDIAALQDRWRIRRPEAVGFRADYRDEVRTLLQYYAARPLVGREATINSLVEASAGELPGYVLVEAPAMYGKSALFANLVSRAEQGSWGNGPTPDLVFFFVREEGGRNTASAFLTAVNSQLLALIGSTGALAGEQEAQRSQFSQLWSVASKAANSFRPLLLLVDGLDESASDGLSILPFLPSNLEPYVHVFTSVRRDVPLPSLGVEHPLSRAVQLSLDALELAGVEQMLGARGVDLAPRVLAITGGEPLFTVLVGADVAAGGEKRLRELESQGVDGMRSYLRDDFAQLETRVGTDDAEAVLGLLVCIRGPITVDEVAGTLAISRLRVNRVITPMRRFLRGDKRIKLMHPELQDMTADELFNRDDLHLHRRRLEKWCAGFAGSAWPDDTPDYVLRHGVGHIVDALRRSAQPERHELARELAEKADTFIERCQSRLDNELGLDTQSLRDNLRLMVAGTAVDDHPMAFTAVLTTAERAAEWQRTSIRPERIFELAQAGEFDAARDQLNALTAEESWRQAATLLAAWYAADSGDVAARRFVSARQDRIDATVNLLAARVDNPNAGIPPDAELPPAPDISYARDLLSQLGGRVASDPSGMEGLISGRGLLAEIEQAHDASEPPESDAAPIFRAEVEAPQLVSLAAAQPSVGDAIVREYLTVQAANPYLLYRNRSLWAVLGAILRHPDAAWVRQIARDVVVTALSGAGVTFQECVPLTALGLQTAISAAVAAEHGQDSVADLSFDELIDNARKHAAALSQSYGTGDSWGEHKRRLGALSEANAIALGHPALAAQLLEVALAVPVGYAGYQSPACLTLAESALVSSANAQVQRALEGALVAAHNVQDPRFCARVTSRTNALIRRWWPSAPTGDGGLLASADRLAADANTPEFAALHLVGETYPERAQDRITVPLPPRVLDARTPAALAIDVFECPLSELIRLNAGRGWEADTVLDDGTEVHIPDSDLAPMLAARLAAEALVVPNLSATERTTIIQRLVPPALENPTALDTVLGRLLLAARPTRSEDIADITNSAVFTSHRPVPWWLPR